MPGRVAAERELAGGLRLEQQQRHPAEHAPLEALLERVQPDLELGVLPQQHVVLEVHGHVAVELHVQRGDQLALEAIGQTRSRALGDLSGQDLRCCRHGLSCSGRCRNPCACLRAP